MRAEKLKHSLFGIFGNQIRFNKEFKKHAKSLGNQEDNLLSWCRSVKDKEIAPKPSTKDRDNIIFIKKLGSSNRCIVIKIKNDIFKEIHLGDHAYYDRLRKSLGLKKDST